MACKTIVLAALLLADAGVYARRTWSPCAARALLDSGWVCGARRVSPTGTEFVSFLGVPYAKQPLGHLRFQELQPVDPWENVYEATKEGPVCPQRDLFYGRIMQPKDTTVTEACIHANIHVPLDALPKVPQERYARELEPPHEAGVGDDDGPPDGGPGLPILVFIHGGGFDFGSGDTDVHGPEYLVARGVIVITFNYRLNVFGFLSLNSSRVPGNNGLRDMVTLLRWVQRNARALGGDPDDVTVGGHSAGASSANLLMLSDAAKGLFKRVLSMSGTAFPTFYTTSPAYAQFVSNMFLTGLGINSTDAEEVHRQLVETPLEKLMEVHHALQDVFGLTVFFPVVESPVPNFTTILNECPEVLLAKGRGKDIPFMVGFTNAECYGFQPRLEQIDILANIKRNPIILAPVRLIYTRPNEVALEVARRVRARYFRGEPTMDEYIKLCQEANFKYPALKVAQSRAAAGGAPVYLYEFSYESDFSVKKLVDKTNYTGAGHFDDLTYIFRVNSILGPDFKATKNDENVKDWMVDFVTNFMRCSDPACSRDTPPGLAAPWPPFTDPGMSYRNIDVPFYRTLQVDSEQLDLIRFFDSLENITS